MTSWLKRRQEGDAIPYGRCLMRIKNGRVGRGNGLVITHSTDKREYYWRYRRGISPHFISEKRQRYVPVG